MPGSGAAAESTVAPRGHSRPRGSPRPSRPRTAGGVRNWLTGFGDAPFDYQTRDLKIAAGGDVAYAHCLAKMGSPGVFGMWFHLTVCLRKTGPGWRITHTHASTPFYMDETQKAALDLQP
jgi:ketosteroid isomerase-like protein